MPGQESALVGCILELLQYRGAHPIRINSGVVVMEDPQGSKRVFRGAAVGTSDVIACLPGGRFAAIEAKVYPNKPTRAQMEFLLTIERIGGLARVCYDISDLDDLFPGSG